MMKKEYPYSLPKALLFDGTQEPATDKQISYIESLSMFNSEALQEIIDSIPEFEGMDYATKGDAHFIIACLRGEIKPYGPRQITPGATQLPLACTCGCNHIRRSEVVNGTYMIAHVTCQCPKEEQHMFYDPAKLDEILEPFGPDEVVKQLTRRKRVPGQQ